MTEKSELQNKYETELKAKLKEAFGITNDMAVPTIKKIVVNAGIGSEYKNNSGIAEEMVDIIAQITGQKPVITKAKISVSNFKLKEGQPNGVMVTLRGTMMWDFLYKLINITLPRIKDFRGVSQKAFDGKGNYSLGIKEHTIFPEIDTSTLVKIRPLQVVVNTTATNNEQGYKLLELLGMPFKKN